MFVKNLEGETGRSKFQEIARIYCQIWKEPPWNEDFWTEEAVVEDLQKQSKKPGALILAASNGSAEIVGFTWGYKTSIADMAEISGLSEDLWEGIIGKDNSFYIDELGVDIGSRGKGIGTALAEELLKEVSRDGIKCVLLRTDTRATPARRVYEKVGFRELPIRDANHENRTYWLKE